MYNTRRLTTPLFLSREIVQRDSRRPKGSKQQQDARQSKAKQNARPV
jgi:hypothetical protein